MGHHVHSDLGPMRLWITIESGENSERYFWSATSVELKRHAMVDMVIFVGNRVTLKGLGPHDH